MLSMLRTMAEHLAEHLRLHVVEILEHPPEQWEGETGWLTEPILEAALQRHRVRGDLDYFIRGPGPMVAAASGILHEWAPPTNWCTPSCSTWSEGPEGTSWRRG